MAENTAVKECARVGVTVVAIADTNCDPQMIDYPIPGNDDAIKSIQILTDAIAASYGAGLKQAGKVAAKQAVKDEAAARKKAEEEIAPDLKEEVAAAEEEIEKKEVKESERVV